MIMNKKGAVKNVRFFTAPFQGIGKKDAEQKTEQKQGFRLVFVCPKAYKGTSSGEVCL